MYNILICDDEQDIVNALKISCPARIWCCTRHIPARRLWR